MVGQIQVECLVVASEECAELTKECMKILRFGIDDDKRNNLISEMGDVMQMLELLGNHFGIDDTDIKKASAAKRNKLKKWSNLIDG
tara:strand:+ start:63 stop:320 length:258 start_codon:yes stop_codon:yes gene_type:complete